MNENAQDQVTALARAAGSNHQSRAGKRRNVD
jgi:hypothetical protein